ncbi:MAG: hypothetical protein Kow0019_11710 [Methanobacteriaceae archaeon]
MKTFQKEPISILLDKQLLLELQKSYESSKANSFSKFIELLIRIGFTELRGELQ